MLIWLGIRRIKIKNSFIEREDKNLNYLLQEYYEKYLRDIKGLKDSTVKHYAGALRTISKYLVDKNKIQQSIYEVKDVEEIIVLRDFLYQDVDFLEKDQRGNRMYSAGLNNYCNFISGEDLDNEEEFITALDIAIPVNGTVEVTTSTWSRSDVIKRQAIKAAAYSCELNREHRTFISAKSNRQYMEGHHIIPMAKQNYFENSLDVYANILSVCPVCHKMLHYGLREDRKKALEIIYAKRAERLGNSGIQISHDKFMEILS